ncbi:MAG: hypothetical protein J6Z18_07485 [Prevotella sp.]|nr:hypothetical protein [Prevotella sp.]
MKLKLRILRTDLKIISMLCLLLMTAVAGLAGCDNADDSKTTLSPVKTDELVDVFFRKASNDIGRGIISFFPERKQSTDVSPLIINNVEDLRSAYYGKDELPTIDFSKYTLIIGAVYITAGIYVKEQKLILNERSATLHLFMEMTDEAVITNFNHELYWGLYPKLSIRNINVKKYRDGKEWNL